MTSPVEESFTGTSKTPYPAWVAKLPSAILISVCIWVVLEISLMTASAVGIIECIFYLLISPFVIVLAAIPFCVQVHRSNNVKGLLRGIAFCSFVFCVNLGTVVSHWPLKLTLALDESKLIEISDSLRPGQRKPLGQRIGFMEFREAWKLPNGHTCFANGWPGDATGLIYSATGSPKGINEWSNFRINDHWAVVIQD